MPNQRFSMHKRYEIFVTFIRDILNFEAAGHTLTRPCCSQAFSFAIDLSQPIYAKLPATFPLQSTAGLPLIPTEEIWIPLYSHRWFSLPASTHLSKIIKQVFSLHYLSGVLLETQDVICLKIYVRSFSERNAVLKVVTSYGCIALMTNYPSSHFQNAKYSYPSELTVPCTVL